MTVLLAGSICIHTTCVQVLCTVVCTDMLSNGAVWTSFFVIVYFETYIYLKHIPLLNNNITIAFPPLLCRVAQHLRVDSLSIIC